MKITDIRVGDYVRKDGHLVRVEELSAETIYTSDGGCMGADELGEGDLLLESEVLV